MADYSTQSGGGGRWLIFAGIAVAIIILVAVLAAGPTSVDPGAMPAEAGSTEVAPAAPEAVPAPAD